VTLKEYSDLHDAAQMLDHVLERHAHLGSGEGSLDARDLYGEVHEATRRVRRVLAGEEP
jgi:hypothetical protein